MKKKTIQTIIILLICKGIFFSEVLSFKGEYLGQNKPGIVPEIFAPGIISLENQMEGGFTISRDGKMIIYRIFCSNKKDPLILKGYLMKKEDWFELDSLPFDSPFKEWDFNFSRKKNQFFFTSNHPLNVNDREEQKESKIWVIEYKNSEWSEPALLKKPINKQDSFSGYPSISNKGTMYFHSNRKNGFGLTDIYFAESQDERFSKVKNAGNIINSDYEELDPNISPDESYLIFMSTRPSSYFSDGDMYISFRDKNGQWSKSIALGGILGYAGHPCISSDGKYLFYTRMRNKSTDIYWVSTQIFDSLKYNQITIGDNIKYPIEKAALFLPEHLNSQEDEMIFGLFNEGKFAIIDRISTDFSKWDKYPIYTTQLIKDNWTTPELTENLGKPWYYNHPNPNENDIVFFSWWFPLDSITGNIIDINIWKAEYKNKEWQKPVKLEFPINTNFLDSWPSVDRNGTLYFFSTRSNGMGSGDIYQSFINNGKYKAVYHLEEPVNTEYLEHDPCVNYDGDILIFSSNRKGGMGNDDLYAAFKDSCGLWKNVINLGDKVNSEYSENRPYLSSDGKYLFFSSNRNGSYDIFEIQTDFIKVFCEEVTNDSNIY